MSQESTSEFYNEHLEKLRDIIGDNLGLADKVDEVYASALTMQVGDIQEFDVRHSILRVELTMDGFKAELRPKGGR